MRTQTLLPLALALPLVSSQQQQQQQPPTETILGAYIFHRHGDRTPKILAPTNLTDLGYRQVYQSGQYYRSRYVAADATHRIAGLNSDEVLPSQVSASAPDDVVLEQSAVGFLQGLYPPVGVEGEALANGSTVDAPMDGYQIVPVGQTETGAGSEDAGWLQSTTDCGKAVVSSNEYYSSAEFIEKLASTKEFYEQLSPVIDGVFAEDERNFDNAYTIYDYINFATIHNTTIPSAALLTPSTLLQLRTLADTHEFHLAYNRTAPIRAIAGAQLAGEITHFLAATVAALGTATGSKLGVQFGAYGTFMSFFGLAGLVEESADYEGVTGYASSMVFELFTRRGEEAETAGEEDVFVRFLYHNGTASAGSPPQVWPLFGTGEPELRWKDFLDRMNAFAIGDVQGWCTACGNVTGECAAFAPEGTTAVAGSEDDDAHVGCANGLNPVVNGVVGALVALAVVLGVEGLVLVVGGFRVVRKASLAEVVAVEEGLRMKA